MPTHFHYNSQDIKRIAKLIDEAFSWDTTPHGSDFWDGVYTALVHLAHEAELQGDSKDSSGIELIPDPSQIQLDVTPPEITHIYHQGKALCDIKGDPRDWPKGHYRVTFDDRQHSTCTDCIKEALKILP